MNIFNRKVKDPTKYYIPDRFSINNAEYQKIIEETNGVMDRQIGEEIENIYDSKYIICLHRTEYDFEIGRDEIILTFMTGLKNFGGSDLVNTATPFKHFPILISQLLASHTYKQNGCKGVIIIKIPKKDIGMAEGEALPIWFPTIEKDYRNICACRLLPEYIYGFVDCDVIDGKKKGAIIKNPNYSDVHDYQPDGLLYDSKVYDSIYQRKLNQFSQINAVKK